MRYGAKHALWAPFVGEEPENAMPTYGEACDFGGINESNETLNFGSAAAYSNNQKNYEIRDFTSGTIAAKALDQPIAVASQILGTATDEDGGQSFGGDDEQPFGAYGFFCSRIDANKKKYHEVIFYPKVQGYIEGSNYKTKEDGITLEYDSVSFNIYQANCGKYKITKRFDAEAAAVTYLKGLFTGTSAVPGLTAAGDTI